MTTTCKSLLLFLVAGCSVARSQDVVLVEAVAFSDHGGWVLDQQFMDLMGSPFAVCKTVNHPLVSELLNLGMANVLVEKRRNRCVRSPLMKKIRISVSFSQQRLSP